MNVVLVHVGNIRKDLLQDKPEIIDTLIEFENNPSIDEIEVIWFDDWHDIVWKIKEVYGITKLKRVSTESEK